MPERDKLEWGSEAELIEGMRQRDPGALRAFFFRFHPCLLQRARRSGLSASEADECATELLDDVAVLIIEGQWGIPERLIGYLLQSVRNRIANLHRGAMRRERLHGASADDSDHGAVPDTSSPRGEIAAAEDEAEEVTTVSPALERLAVELHRDLTPDEQQLLEWLVHRASASVIGEHLGISRQATKQRIRRLRQRLVQAAIRHANSCDDREELIRFFRRVGALATLLPPKHAKGSLAPFGSPVHAGSPYATRGGDAA